jgi:hypothetical protein
MVQFRKLTINLILTLHGQNVHRQQRHLSKFLMCCQQFASHAYCGAAGQVSKMASQQEKAFRVLRFEVSISVIRTADSTRAISSSKLCTKLTLLCTVQVRNKFIVNCWNCTILLCIPCIIPIPTHSFRGTDSMYTQSQSFRFLSVRTLKNRTLFSSNWKWPETWSTRFWCLSNQSKPPPSTPDHWKGATVHDQTCLCVHMEYILSIFCELWLDKQQLLNWKRAMAMYCVSCN